MTDDEVNRTFDVVAGHMATLAVGLDTLRGEVSQLTATVTRLAEKVDRNADAVSALLTLAEMHEREITENREAQARTDERLNALIDTVERYISEGRGGQG